MGPLLNGNAYSRRAAAATLSQLAGIFGGSAQQAITKKHGSGERAKRERDRKWDSIWEREKIPQYSAHAFLYSREKRTSQLPTEFDSYWIWTEWERTNVINEIRILNDSTDKPARLRFCQTQPKWLQTLRRQCCLCQCSMITHNDEALRRGCTFDKGSFKNWFN